MKEQTTLCGIKRIEALSKVAYPASYYTSNHRGSSLKCDGVTSSTGIIWTVIALSGHYNAQLCFSIQIIECLCYNFCFGRNYAFNCKSSLEISDKIIRGDLLAADFFIIKMPV